MGDAPRSRGRVSAGARVHRAPVAGSSLLLWSVVLLVAAPAASCVTGFSRARPAAAADRVATTSWASPLSPAAPLPPPATENPSWSGELAWATKNGSAAYGDVTGAWVQPAVAPSSGPQYADTWVGVDGYDGKLLQAGTTAESDGSAATYDAWFVAWSGNPSGMTVIDEPVAAGDHMDVAIVRDATGEWTVHVEDATAGWTWSTTVTYPANGSTAEWIEEAPGTWSTPSRYQALADYGAVTFTTVRANGSAPAVVTAFDIAQNGEVASYPETYDSARSTFAVRYGRPVPALHAISPPSGPASGGTLVQLTGANLGASPTVLFGKTVATVIRSSTSSIVVEAPPHAPGEVPVTVSVDDQGAIVEAVGSPPVGFDYASEPGYVELLASGSMAPFGSAHGVAVPQHLVGAVVGVARDSATGGYWEATSGGGVYDMGAPDLGTLAALVQRLNLGPVAGIAATPTGDGYWLVTAKGGVFEFGAARSFGTLRGTRLAARIVGMSPTPTGQGYWLVGADGGVFTFGTARFYGSAGGLHLRAAIVGMSPTPTGEGYWLVGADGGVFTFGAARFYGSAATAHLGWAVVGVAASTTGRGYWLAAADGEVLAFGSAPYLGSASAHGKPSSTVGILAG